MPHIIKHEEKKVPVTKDQELFNALEANQDFAQQTVAPAIVKTSGDISTANSQLLDTTRRLAGERETIVDDIRGAQDRLFNLEQNPEIINTILGFFDSDFSEGAQIRRLQRGSFELSEITNRMAVAESTRNVQVQDAANKLRSVTDFYEFNRQGILDQTTAVLNSFQIREGVRQEQVKQVENTPDKVLEKWESNPDSMPPNLKGLQQLASAEIFRRRVKNAQLTSIDIANTQARENLFGAQREDYFNRIDTMDELVTAQNRFKTNRKDFPPYVRENDFNIERQRREDIDLSLRSARQSVAAKDLQLAEVHKQIALTKATLGDIDTIIANIGGDGNANLNGVIFTRAELASARAVKSKELIDRQKSNAILITAITGVDGIRASASESAIMLGHIGNPYGDPLAGMPTDVRQQIQSAERATAALQPMIDAGDVGSAIVVSKLWQETDKTIKAAIETRVANTTKASKPAIREYSTQQGRITTPSAAAGLLIENAPNIFALDADSVLKSGYRAFAQSLIETSDGGSTINIESGIISIGGDAKENAAVIQQAITDSKLRSRVGDSGFQLLLQQTLFQLAVDKETNTVDQTSPYAQFIDDSGVLSETFYQFERGQSKVFDYNKLYAAMASAQLDAVAGGLIPQSKLLYNPIIDMMRKNAPGLNDRFTASPVAAALRTAAFPNGMQETIYTRLAKMASTMPAILQNTIDKRASLANALQQLTTGQGIGTDPGVGP